MAKRIALVAGLLALVAILVFLALTPANPEESPGASSRAPAVAADGVPEGLPDARRAPERRRTAQPAAAGEDAEPDPADTAAPGEDVEPTLTMRVTVLGGEARTPVAGARIRLLDDDWNEIAAGTTDAAGRWECTDLPEGRVVIDCIASGWVRPYRRSPELVSGEPGDVEIVLEEGPDLTGVVLSAFDGRPLAGAHVEVTRGGSIGNTTMSSSAPPLGDARTGADGRFVVVGMARAEIITVVATAKGYVSASRSLMVPSEEGAPAALELRLDRSGTLTGVARDPDGVPLAGASVHAVLGGQESLIANPNMTVTSSAGSFEALTSVTDDRGRYELTGLALGANYHLFATHPDFARSEVALDVWCTAVAPHGTRDLALRASASLRVRVLDAAGRPLEAAEATLSLPHQYLTAKTSADGRVPFDGRVPESGTLSVRIRGHALTTRDVVLLAGKTIDLDVRLQAGVAIEGVMVNDAGEPLSDRSVVARRPYGPEYRDLPESEASAATDEEGRFRLTGLLPGPHFVRTYGGNEERLETGTLEAPRKDLRLVARRNASGVLRLRLPEGAAPPEAMMLHRGNSGSSVNWPADGVLDVPRVPPGQQTVRVRLAGYLQIVIERDFEPGSHVDLGEIVLDPGVDARGRVEDLEGRPIAGADVSTGDFWLDDATVVTNDAGAFVLHHQPLGRVEVTVRAEGYVELETEIDVASGGAESRIALPRGAVLRVLVLDEAGRSVPDSTVKILGLEGPEDDRFEDWFHTDARGETAPRLAPARYSVQLLREDEAVASAEVTLVEGKDQELRLGPSE